MNSLGAENYRIIMQKMEVEYLYQGKEDVQAEFYLDRAYLEDHVLRRINTNDAVLETFTVQVKDSNQNDICKADITWQIKPWSKVKTKI